VGVQTIEKVIFWIFLMFSPICNEWLSTNMLIHVSKEKKREMNLLILELIECSSGHLHAAPSLGPNSEFALLFLEKHFGFFSTLHHCTCCFRRGSGSNISETAGAIGQK